MARMEKQGVLSEESKYPQKTVFLKPNSQSE